jgi:hypothetical protein
MWFFNGCSSSNSEQRARIDNHKPDLPPPFLILRSSSACCRWQGKSKLFLPMNNCFEVFGFDFLVRSNLDVVVLEVNGGPAMEGVAMPELCQHLVDDVLKVCPFGMSLCQELLEPAVGWSPL